MTATLPLHSHTTVRQRAAHRQAQRAVYQRRRLAVLAATVAVVVGLVATTQGVGADDGSAPITGEPVHHVVQPGESLWSIAEDLAPGRDVRPIVHELERSAGTSLLQAGQVLVIPAGLVE